MWFCASLTNTGCPNENGAPRSAVAAGAKPRYFM